MAPCAVHFEPLLAKVGPLQNFTGETVRNCAILEHRCLAIYTVSGVLEMCNCNSISLVHGFFDDTNMSEVGSD